MRRFIRSSQERKIIGSELKSVMDVPQRVNELTEVVSRAPKAHQL